MHFSSPKGFTLVELMIIIAIIGVLAGSLFPSYVNYVQRGRDAARVAAFDSIGKALNLYFSENEDYPPSDSNGCVDGPSFVNYGGTIKLADPKSDHNNGCNVVGQYGYGMSTGLLFTPDAYILIAVMEQATTGNFGGSILGMTGSSIQSGPYALAQNVERGTGSVYLRTP